MRAYCLILILFGLSVVTYIDRACVSSAKESISLDLSLTDTTMGFVFGAFALGYALAQIPAGWLADKVGARKALVAVVIAWSALTVLTGIAWNSLSLVVIRFLFGVAEAGAFPCSARAVYDWLPVYQRGRANGIMFSGSRLGAALAFPMLLWLIDGWGWRISFALLGGIGFVWVAVWWLWSSNLPEVRTPSSVNGTLSVAEFIRIVRSRALFLAMIQYFASNFTFFISLSWMFPYLRQHYGLTRSHAATLAMLPLLVGAMAQWISGVLVDYLYRRGIRKWSRRLPAMFGFMLASIGILVVTFARTSTLATAWFCVATFGTEMTISPSWAYCLDIGGSASGAVSASMNMLGNLSAFISANAFPLLQRWTGSSSAYFDVAALLNAAGILCWLKMHPDSRRYESVPESRSYSEAD